MRSFYINPHFNPHFSAMVTLLETLNAGALRRQNIRITFICSMCFFVPHNHAFGAPLPYHHIYSSFLSDLLIRWTLFLSLLGPLAS